MTKEEAKEYIRECLEYHEAEEIIKALDPENCEDAVSRKVAKENALNLCLETSYDNEKVVEMLDDLPSVKPVVCIGTVKFSKEDMQKIVDDAVKELVLENAR
jgi:uncharacterized protein YeeX (DUF496 family)